MSSGSIRMIDDHLDAAASNYFVVTSGSKFLYEVSLYRVIKSGELTSSFVQEGFIDDQIFSFDASDAAKSGRFLNPTAGCYSVRDNTTVSIFAEVPADHIRPSIDEFDAEGLWAIVTGKKNKIFLVGNPDPPITNSEKYGQLFPTH